MTVEQVPQLVTPAGHRASVRLHFQTENGLFQPQIRFQGRVGMIRVDFSVQVGKITFSAGSDANEVCHACLRTRRKTPSRAESFLFSHSQGPAGYLPRRRREQQYRGVVSIDSRLRLSQEENHFV